MTHPGNPERPAKPMRIFPLIGAVLGLLAVAAGAFGAHALKDKLTPDQLDSFMTAARYQLVHAVLLVALAQLPASRPIRIACGLFVAGILCFAGSIYLLTLANASWAWPITPLGGLLLMLGWGALIIHFATRAGRTDTL